MIKEQTIIDNTMKTAKKKGIPKWKVGKAILMQNNTRNNADRFNQSVWRFEHGKKELKIWHINSLCELLDVTPQSLMGLK